MPSADLATPSRRYYALVIRMTDGLVVNEIPLAADPPWLQQINNAGSWSVTTQIGGSGGLSRDTLRGLVAPGRWGCAICYGAGTWTDPIVQAGPIWTHELVSEDPPILKIGGSGFWGMPSARLQVPGTWITSYGFADTRSVATYGPTSLQGVAVKMLNDMITRGSLPLDVPTAIAGTSTNTYYGYDLAMVGQRLSELTQLDAGPDIVFSPYFSDSNHVRWTASIGNPRLVQPGAALFWDYGANLTTVLPTSDGSKLCTTDFVKGNGMEAAVLWASATDATLTNAGWPLLESVDTSHSNVIDQTQLQGYANAIQALSGRPVETWAATVRTDSSPLLGTYGPGVLAVYNMIGHCWIPDGQYSQRILGISADSSTATGYANHVLQAIQGAI